MDLQLTHVAFRSGHSEQSLCPKILWVLSEIAREEPENQRWTVLVLLVSKFKLSQVFTKDV